MRIALGTSNSGTAKMGEAPGSLTSELYPPLKETGFKLRSRGPTAMPALIDGTRRTSSGGSEKFLLKAPGGKADAKGAKAEKPSASDKAEATPAAASADDSLTTDTKDKPLDK